MNLYKTKPKIVLLVVWVFFMNMEFAQSSLRLGGNTVSQVYEDAKVVALINAATDGRTNDVERLAAQGANVDGVGSDGTTPLI